MNVNCLSVISECHYELEKLNQCHTVTQTQYIYAKQVLLGLEQIYIHRDTISGILNEDKRNGYITQLTHLIAETGLIPGNSSSEILQAMDIRITGLVETYLLDKKNNDLLSFFREGFVGPPCFNGRLITLEHYAFSKYHIKNPLFYDFHTPWDKEAVEIEEIMHAYVEHEGREVSIPPSLEALRSYSLENHLNANLQSILHSDHLNLIYKRACQFFTGA